MIGLLIADDLLLGAFPHQLSTEDIGEIAEVAKRGGALGDFDIDGGPVVAFADGLKPIGLVVHVEVRVFVGARGFHDAGRKFEIDRVRVRAVVSAFPFQDEMPVLTPATPLRRRRFRLSRGEPSLESPRT